MSTTTDSPNSTLDDEKQRARSLKYTDQRTKFTLPSVYADDLIALLHHDIKNSNTKTILDIGCGSGIFVHAYLRAFPNGIPGQTIISSDISPFMIEQAQLSTTWNLAHRVKQQSNQPKITKKCATKFLFQLEDGAQLSGIADHSIDIVVSLHGVFLIEDQVSTLESIQRVLKPRTGIFANVAWTKPNGIDPSFGSYLDDPFLTLARKVKEMKMAESSDSNTSVMRLAMKVNEMKMAERSGNSTRSSISPVPPWYEPTTIATNLTERHNYVNVKTYRVFHSMMDRNFHAIFESCIQNPLIDAKDLSEEQLHTLKHTLFDLCQIPHSSVEEKESIIQNQDENVPFTLWTASNLTIAHVV